MKHITKFNEFLRNEVNLNQSRIDTLVSRTDTIERFLKDSSYGNIIDSFSTQGSWAHKTIIKPPKKNMEFDADMVVYVVEAENWEPKDYIIELARTFRANHNYKEITKPETRCVTLNYSGDFHLDVVPIIVKKSFLFGDKFYVCNKDDNELEQTDGDGFKDWWLEQDQITTNHRLIKSARLFKYLRDTKRTFSCKSILLTTLLGNIVADHEESLGWGESSDDDYKDVPTTLLTLFQRLDNFLQDNEEMPDIENPCLEGESFTRNWTSEQYRNFRNKVHDYREWVEDAFFEEGQNESIRKWRRIFGDEFAPDVVLKSALSSSQFNATILDVSDPITTLRSQGKAILDTMPFDLPHVETPFEPIEKKFKVRVQGYVREPGFATTQERFFSGDILPKNRKLEFVAVNGVGTPLSSGTYQVKWRVVNTGEEASRRRQLRGGFESSNEGHRRREHAEFRGIHWVEAMAVNRRNQKIEGVSDRFFVAID